MEELEGLKLSPHDSQSIHNKTNVRTDYLIIGAGFSGLTLGLRLVEAGKSVVIVESDSQVGGLAADFKLSNNHNLERFYHHWFNNDYEINKIVRNLGLTKHLKEYPSNTGMYFNKTIWRLSSPIDLLRFKVLSFPDRIRLGIVTLLVRRVKNWKAIEGKSIREWLEPLCGKKVYENVWAPLVNAKFSIYKEDVSAAWMWKKLALRGSTRQRNGHESLLYIEGGFGRLAQSIAKRFCDLGGEIFCEEKILELVTGGDQVVAIKSSSLRNYHPTEIIFTGAPEQLASIMRNCEETNWIEKLNSINYLANICLVLLLDRSLSDTYWLNVNDPGFPFVGVIEHTNLVSSKDYGNLHVVYLSRYISTHDADFKLDDDLYFEKCVDSLMEMFPNFEKSWIKEHYIWRAPFAQPIITKNYSELIPKKVTPFKNLYFNSMAQIYPEDRGTNYAIKSAESLAEVLLNKHT
jgi:protoporphyrinogen oxidase